MNRRIAACSSYGRANGRKPLTIECKPLRRRQALPEHVKAVRAPLNRDGRTARIAYSDHTTRPVHSRMHSERKLERKSRGGPSVQVKITARHGHLDEAIAEFRAVLRMEPGNSEANRVLQMALGIRRSEAR